MADGVGFLPARLLADLRDMNTTTDRCPSIPNCRGDVGCCLPYKAVGFAELELLSGIGRVVTGHQGAPVDLRPVASAGRCTRCGGHTWQLQAHDICGRCGSSTQHEAPEARPLPAVPMPTRSSSKG